MLTAATGVGAGGLLLGLRRRLGIAWSLAALPLVTLREYYYWGWSERRLYLATCIATCILLAPVVWLMFSPAAAEVFRTRGSTLPPELRTWTAHGWVIAILATPLALFFAAMTGMLTLI